MTDGGILWKMIDNRKNFFIVFGLILFFAIILRFAGVNGVPLTSTESANAVQALNLLSQEVTPSIGQPLYIIFTNMVFWLFQASALFARLIPATAGVLVVLTPLFFRKALQAKTILLFSAFLAIDPLLVGLSRFASGDMIAVLSLICIIAFICNKKPIFAGIAFGIGILSGSFFWAGFLIVVITIAIIQLTGIDNKTKRSLSSLLLIGKHGWRRFSISGTLTFLLLGSGFASHPIGWQLTVSSITEFFKGFASGPELPVKAYLAGLLGYASLPLFSGLLILGVQKISEKLNQKFIWLLIVIAFIFALLYPTRNIYFAIYLVLPLWLYISSHILETFQLDRFDLIPFLIGTMVIITLILFTYSNLRGMYSGSYQIYPSEIQIAALIGGFVLIGLTLILIIWGWGLQLGINLFISSFGLLLLVFSTGAMLGVMGSKDSHCAEMTARQSVIMDEKLMVDTISDIAKREFQSGQSVNIDVVNFREPSLDWALRNIRTTNHINAINQTTMTPMIITSIDGQVESSIGYRGQDFVWSRLPDWNTMTGSDYLNWLLSRKIKFTDEYLILWVRSDLFAE